MSAEDTAPTTTGTTILLPLLGDLIDGPVIGPLVPPGGDAAPSAPFGFRSLRSSNGNLLFSSVHHKIYARKS